MLGSNHAHSKTEVFLDTFMLKVKMDKRILSRAQLLVYYVLPVSGEIVVASTEVNLEKCLPNKVSYLMTYTSVRLIANDLTSGRNHVV